MKGPSKNRLKGHKSGKKVQKGHVGDVGVATAPQSKPFLPLSPRTPQKQGLGPVSTHPATEMPTDVLERIALSSVVRTTADDGNLYYVWKLCGKVTAIPVAVVTETFAKVYSALLPVGIIAISPAQKAAVRQKFDEAPETDKVIVVTRNGYEHVDRPRFYAMGDGSLIKSDASLRLIGIGNPDDRFEERGSRRTYERNLARVIRNQPIPLMVFFYALTPALQPFAMQAECLVQNTMLELSGSTSRYKSALTNFLAGSVWGGTQETLGFADSWNITPASAEEAFIRHQNGLLVLDEATMAASSEKERGNVIGNVVHRLTAGKKRGRKGEVSAHFQLMALSNSNQSLASILDAAPEVKAALEVRLITLQVPKRETGPFEFVPRGFDSVHQAMGLVFATVNEHRGLLARRFIRDVLAWSRRDHESLIRFIRTQVERFISDIGLGSGADAAELRRAKPFALTYAAAAVAFKAETLRRKRWGKVRRTLVEAWFRYGNPPPSSPVRDEVDEFLADETTTVVDLPYGVKPEIAGDSFDRVDAFIYRDKKRQLNLAMTPAKMRKHLKLSAAALKQLKKSARLRATENLRMRLRLRCLNGVEQREVFYLFPIPKVPDHAVSISDARRRQRRG
jgi:Superfamily II helicase and inactivated derivatives